MVEEVSAWRDSAGKLHDSKLEAARSDAITELNKLEMFNHASAMAIVKAAKQITPILQQVLWAEEEAAIKDEPGDGIVERMM